HPARGVKRSDRSPTQAATLFLVVAPVEDVPLPAAGNDALGHACTDELVQPIVEREGLGEDLLGPGEEEVLVANLPEAFVGNGFHQGVRQERQPALGERHRTKPRAFASRCLTSCSTRRRSSSSRRIPGAPCRTRRAASAAASRSISASCSKLWVRIWAKRAWIRSSGATRSSTCAAASR